MGRYLWPWLLYCGSAVVSAWPPGWQAAIALYVLASIWWMAVTVTARPPQPVHFALTWAPSIPPVLILGFSFWASLEVDAGAMVVIPMLMVVPAFLAVSLAGMIALWARSRRARA